MRKFGLNKVSGKVSKHQASKKGHVHVHGLSKGERNHLKYLATK